MGTFYYYAEYAQMSTQQRGVIRTWKDDKGFGFITPDSGGGDIFFHVKEVVGRHTRPTEHMVVFFNVKRDEQQRLQAVNVHLDTESVLPVVVSLLTICIFFGILGFFVITRILPPWIPLVYLAMSGITYVTYGNDKTKAVTGQRRVPESHLHLLEFFCGWPGALVAQSYFRHKNRKSSYQVVYWTLVLLNLLLLGFGVFLLFSF